jgi:hypothetical protein
LALNYSSYPVRPHHILSSQRNTTIFFFSFKSTGFIEVSSILLCSCNTMPHFTLFCFTLLCFVLFCFVLFCFVLFCFVLFVFCIVLFCLFFVLLYFSAIINSFTAYGLFDLIYAVTIDSCLCSWLRWVSLRSDWGGAGTVCRGLCVVHEAGE